MLMMKNFSPLVLTLLLFSQALFAQIGIGTTAPEASLDVQSVANGGMLIPRVALTSTTDNTTVVNTDSGALAESTLVYNDGTGGLTPAGFYYWKGTQWEKLADNTDSRTYTGKLRLTSTGSININTLPFSPTAITFTAYANVENYTLDSDNAASNNNSGIANSFGYMTGFANNHSGSIAQQVICGGGSGNSINDISRYASPNHCIGIRYANQNGDKLGITSASLTSFDNNGFTLNVDSYADGLVIIYTAYR